MRFKDVTAGRKTFVSFFKHQSEDTNTIKIFSNGATKIIYSSTEKSEKVSISNLKRDVKQSEVSYAIKKVLMAQPASVEIFYSINGGYPYT
ncbi:MULTISPECIES: DUF1827 family protein [Priestia]|uniref:DUF1827 family protein n=1 Tax=Priestia TaxID=2800373 RepID=UPI001596F78D|nr:DUF1827 family protein [Priestia megaterium]MDW4509969.1 DUF1827 family protein [Priestia megaterium]